MASDTKRQNVGKTPVALPNSVPTQPAANTVSLETALSGAIGSRVRITTAAPTSSTIEGTLFTADPVTNLVAINASPAPSTATTTPLPSGSYRIIPISQIANFQILSLPTNGTTSFTTAIPALRQLDLNALRAREAAAIRKAHESLARRGPKGTTKEAQDIFDAISRTHPARWQGTSMLVSDSVLIEKPYHPDNVKMAPGGGGPAGGVERIKKVLKMEREKLDLKAAGAKFDVGGVGKGKAEKERKGG